MYFKNNLNIIFALTNSHYFVGNNNQLPCSIPEDMTFFRKITIGDGNNAIIMGKNTFLSLPRQKPLPKRLNIVVSSTYVNQSSDPNLIITPTLKDAIKIANGRNCDQIFYRWNSNYYRCIL